LGRFIEADLYRVRATFQRSDALSGVIIGGEKWTRIDLWKTIILTVLPRVRQIHLTGQLMRLDHESTSHACRLEGAALSGEPAV
jgi:hypothetical protein